MIKTKTVVGLTLIIVGLILITVAGIPGLIYGPIIGIIGILFIIFNKDEETIEKRKDINTKKPSKKQ